MGSDPQLIRTSRGQEQRESRQETQRVQRPCGKKRLVASQEGQCVMRWHIFTMIDGDRGLVSVNWMI